MFGGLPCSYRLIYYLMSGDLDLRFKCGACGEMFHVKHLKLYLKMLFSFSTQRFP